MAPSLQPNSGTLHAKFQWTTLRSSFNCSNIIYMNKPRPSFSFKRTFLIVMIIGFVFMMMDLNSRLSALFRLTGQRDQVSTEVGQLQSTKDAVQSQIDFATSDAAVGQWARQEHMGKPGDKLIAPLAGAKATPVPKVLPTTVPETASAWEIWRELFFGE
jgi:hypothetical protein